jgi:hypothetical protein
MVVPRGVPKNSTYRRLFERVLNGQPGVSPRQAIKAQCLDCTGLDRQAVSYCRARVCPLWRYRPYQAGGLNVHE